MVVIRGVVHGPVVSRGVLAGSFTMVKKCGDAYLCGW
jgi:hypothetical protein